MRVIFSVGCTQNSKIMKKLAKEVKLHGDILQTNFVEDNRHHVLKTYSNLRYVISHCSNVQYIYYSDSDVILFPTELLKLVESSTFPRNNTIVGKFWIFNLNVNFTEFEYLQASFVNCNGIGYLMTGDVPDKLLKVIPNGFVNWQWGRKFQRRYFAGFLSSLAKIQLEQSTRFVYKEDDGILDMVIFSCCL